jgi:hypothetical protein
MDGNIYIADIDDSKVYKVDIIGILTTYLGTGTSSNSLGLSLTTSNLNEPFALYFNNENRMIYVSEKAVVKRTVDLGPTSNPTSSPSGPTTKPIDYPTSEPTQPRPTSVPSSIPTMVATPITDFVRVAVIAGTGTNGYSGDNGLATNAKIQSSFGVWSDTKGNTYFTTSADDRVRSVNAATGIITTLMGVGYADYTSVDGPATAMPLYSPGGIVGDTLGTTLYFSDSFHVWKYTIATGIATRYAGASTKGDIVTGTMSAGNGGPATSAYFGAIGSLFLTTDGTIYICDFGAHYIRKVSSPSHIISLISGTGIRGYAGDNGLAISTSVQFSSPYGCYVDSLVVVFIADYLNHRIRKINSAGIIITFAGGGFAITDGVAATTHWLNSVPGVTGDMNGNIYFTDIDDHKGYKVDITGILTTYLGTGAAGTSLGLSSTHSNLNAPFSVYFNSYENALFVGEKNLIKRTVDIHPSSVPSTMPIGNPTSSPSVYPSVGPSASPTAVPSTSFPSSEPSGRPSVVPMNVPSSVPSTIPSAIPVSSPTMIPTNSPAVPTSVPSSTPTNPTSVPTTLPTGLPSVIPSSVPSTGPSVKPSTRPSSPPSSIPSSMPSSEPSTVPSGLPTAVPTSLLDHPLLQLTTRPQLLLLYRLVLHQLSHQHSQLVLQLPNLLFRLLNHLLLQRTFHQLHLQHFHLVDQLLYHQYHHLRLLQRFQLSNRQLLHLLLL